MTKFILSFARSRKASLYSAIVLGLATSFFLPPQAHANAGLQAYYYDNYTGQDNLYNNAPPIPPITPLVASIPVANVDQDYDAGPVAGLIDDFVVKYEGYLTVTESGTVNLQCLADDGCIVIIDGATIIDEWWDKGTDGGVYQYTLVPNRSLPFTLWYYENGGGAVVQLRWQFADRDWSVVPESVFSTVPQQVQLPVVETSTIQDSLTVVETNTVETVTLSAPVEPPAPAQSVAVAQVPPAVEPQPAVEPEPLPDSEPPAPDPLPEEPQPEPEPVADVPPVPESQPEPDPLPQEETVEPEPSSSVDTEVEVVPSVSPVIVTPTVTLANGVMLTQEVATALELFNNPSELLGEIFSNPGAVLTAFSNIGADMSPQVRDKAEKTIVAAVIVGQIATQSAVTAAAGAASYRRKS